ncbi:MAG: GTPase HflX [Caulobacterales bacterium]
MLDPANRALVIYPEITGKNERMRDPELRLAEARGLAEALDLDVVEGRIERLRAIKPGLFFGEGKVKEVSDVVEADKIGIVFIDAGLTPIQQRNLERKWNLKVIDRTGVILEIFGRRARTSEGRVQVELARLEYERSRLVRTWTHLERQRGGFGFLGGPGETQIEADRRLLADKIARLKKQLDSIRRTRGLHRASRKKVPYPIVAVVGYTNAGKSTLFNQLTGADVLAKDMPFATLDPTMRLVRLPSGRAAILSDTVGFITDLPTQLVAAFRATLEEVAEADLLLHVLDISNPESAALRDDVLSTLDQVFEGRGERPPTIEVWNKSDILEPSALEATEARAAQAKDAFVASAVAKTGLDAVVAALDEKLAAGSQMVELSLGANAGAARAWLFEHGEVGSEAKAEEGDENLILQVRMTPGNISRFRRLFPAAQILSQV